MRVEWISIQGSGEWNEDAVVINEAQGLYGVIDGATSLVPFRGPNQETGGRLASQLVKRYLEDYTGPIPAYGGLEQLLKQANLLLRQEMEVCGIDLNAKEQLWTAGIALIQVTETHVEFAQLGDCMIYALYQDGSIRTITWDHVAHIDQETMLLIKQGLASEAGAKEGLKTQVKAKILANKQKMNTPEGYSVLNGDPAAELYIESGKLNRIMLRGLILVTDGLFFPQDMEDNDQDRHETMIRHMSATNLQAYADWLLQLENEDSACIRYPRFKTSDDKSAIWLHFGT